jgi:hypothetical protein
VAGWIAGAGVAASGDSGLAGATAATAFGTPARPIGRGLGKGTLVAAQDSIANGHSPTINARLVASAVDRSGAEMNRVTAFLRRIKQPFLLETVIDGIGAQTVNFVRGAGMLRHQRGEIAT